MSPRIAALPALVALISFGPGCSVLRGSPEPSGPEVRDADLAARIALAFHDGGLPEWERIHVAVEGGAVRLRGIVEAASTRRRAIDLAWAVDGVRSVDAEGLTSLGP